MRVIEPGISFRRVGRLGVVVDGGAAAGAVWLLVGGLVVATLEAAVATCAAHAFVALVVVTAVGVGAPTGVLVAPGVAAARAVWMSVPTSSVLLSWFPCSLRPFRRASVERVGPPAATCSMS